MENKDATQLQFEQYQQDRKQTIEAEYSDAEHYDKWLITLASGAFGISIAFIRYIAPQPTLCSKFFLAASWVFLLLSISATMSSLQFSQVGFRRYREILDKKQIGEDSQGMGNMYIKVVTHLNWSSLALFILGSAMLAIFSFLNL